LEIKLRSLKLCLGLADKKGIVKQIINIKKYIMYLQETEPDTDVDHNLLSFTGYIYKSEKSAIMVRVGIFIKSGLKYMRRLDLRDVECHIMIADVS
jgi:hypothetical protein